MEKKTCLYLTSTNPRRSFTGGIVAFVNGQLTDCQCEQCKAARRQSIMEHQDRELPANNRYCKRGPDCFAKGDV